MKRKTTKKFGVGIFSVVFVFAVFALGYFFGHGNLVLERNYVPRIVGSTNNKPSDVDFGLFWEIYNQISANHIDNLDAKKALYGAISGMVGSLDDPYSAFLTPEETRAFRDDLSGKLEGIGAEIGRRDGLPEVIAPLDGSPADKAGLKAGDKILAIDGEATDKLSLEGAILKIRGPKGTVVKLTILSDGADATKDVEITRDAITVPDVEWKIKDGVAVIRLRQFGETVADPFTEIAKAMQEQNIDKVIIDVRDNPGGLLDKAVQVAGNFVPKGSVVVKQEPKNGQEEILKTSTEPIIPNAKMVILVNKGSASASEILAGAMQDLKRGQVIGVTSFGKGTVQVLEDVQDGAALKLTIAKWLTPNGREINKNGITPDIEVVTDDALVSAGQDPQLDKAYEIVRQ